MCEVINFSIIFIRSALYSIYSDCSDNNICLFALKCISAIVAVVAQNYYQPLTNEILINYSIIMYIERPMRKHVIKRVILILFYAGARACH